MTRLASILACLMLAFSAQAGVGLLSGPILETPSNETFLVTQSNQAYLINVVPGTNVT
jgi:hypothetical protein